MDDDRQRTVIEFSVPGLAPRSYSANGSQQHWGSRAKVGEKYAQAVVLAWLESGRAMWNKAPWQKVHLTLTQKAVSLRDHDNFYASFKPGQDALTVNGKYNIGLLADDKPTVLSVTLLAERVPHRKDQCVVVRLERLDG